MTKMLFPVTYEDCSDARYKATLVIPLVVANLLKDMCIYEDEENRGSFELTELSNPLGSEKKAVKIV